MKSKPVLLLVDDDDAFRLVMAGELERLGFDVYAVGSATEAIEHAARLEPSVVLLDLRLPDLDGLAKLPGESLLAALSMNLPLGPGEKQALLEARTPLIRAELLLALLDLAAPEAGAPAVVRH